MSDTLEIFGITYGGVTGIKAYDNTGTLLTFTRNNNGSSSAPTLQTKTNITPTEASQIITPDTGYDGLSSVQINAISSSYIGSGVNRRSSTDLTINGATITSPAGYYAESASKSVTSGSATTPTTTITVNPSISINSTGLITTTISASQNVTPSVSEGYISSGTSGTVTVSGSNTQQLATQTAKTVAPTESEQTAVASGVYTTGIVKVGAISSTYVGSGISRKSSVDLTEEEIDSENGGLLITASSGYYSSDATKLIPYSNPTINGVSYSSYNGQGSISITIDNDSAGYIPESENVSLGNILLANISNFPIKNSNDITKFGNTVTIPSGYYSEGYTIAIARGSAGTPSATKSTVSNHSISVTPSVTNTTGYIEGETKTGTAVTVTASELASGNKEITSNGTDIDVIGYSTVSVAVPEASLQAKTGINPTTSSQTIIADSGYDGLSSVQINAMPTMTLPTSASSSSSGTSKATIGRSTSAQYINIPTGYNGTASYYTISATPNGSTTTPATTITANPTITVSSSGLITATTSASQNITPTVSAGYVSSGTAGTITVSGSKTQQLTTKGATTYNTSTTDQTIASGTYLTGTQTIKAVTVSGLDASKILSGTTVMVGDANDADRITSVSGTVTFSTITTSSSNPSGGSNGDVWIKTS